MDVSSGAVNPYKFGIPDFFLAGFVLYTLSLWF